jgi:predicted nucleotidyltransferase
MSRKKDREKILFFRESSFEIAKLIFDYPNKEFHIRGLAKETGLSTTSVVRSTDELARFGIVKAEKTEVTTKIRADLDSDAYRFYKKIFNLYRIERHLIIENLRQAFEAEAIVLFGSFAKGEDIEESDIDVLVISNRKTDDKVREFLDICEKELNRKINLIVLPSLKNSSPEFKNAVANGIVLYGYIKVL